MTMKKSIYSLFLMLSLTAGILFIAGCSSTDDDKNVPAISPDTNKKDVTETKTPLANAAISLNENMADLDFSTLKSLTETVPSLNASAPTMTRGDGSNAAIEFESKLKRLLTILQGEEGTTRSLPSVTLGRRFSFQAFNEALQLAGEISITLGEQGESSSSWFGLNSTKNGEVNYTARNGEKYTVKGIVDKNVEVQFRGFNTKLVVTKATELFIYKNGEQVLKILSSSENNRPVWLPILIRDNFYTGQLFYGDFEISLTYDKVSTHERTVDLVYSKADIEGTLLTMSVKLEDDADLKKLLTHDVTVKGTFTVQALDGLLNLNGDVKNVNYLVENGIKISKCMKEGTTEEDLCNSLITDFNDNITLTMSLEDTPIGNIYMGSQYDMPTKRFYPTIMVHSDLLGSEDYRLTHLLEILGVDTPDILKNVAEIAQSE